MDRLRQLIAVTLIVSGIAIADEPARYEFEAGGDISYIDTSGYASWAQGSAGKLRHDGDTNGLQFSRAFAAYKLRVTDTVNATIAVDIYDDDLGSSADFTQAFVEWRPLTMTANRYRLKLGAFYPRISLENTNVDWSTPYTITPSVLNTWVGEELRVFGAEASVSRRPLSLGGVHTFSLHAAVYYNNDPALFRCTRESAARGPRTRRRLRSLPWGRRPGPG